MRHCRIRRGLAAAACASIVLSLAGPAGPASGGSGGAPAGQGAPSACRWSITSAPNPQFADLRDVDGSGPRNVWAVGSRDAGGAPLTMHWNGRRWSIVPSPDPGSLAALEAVAVKSRTNAWAVGWVKRGRRLVTLTLHWNGNRWSVVPSPNPRRGNNLLFDVAFAGSQAYAVGTNNLNPAVGGRTIILRWNGRRWVDDHPSPTRGSLSGVIVRRGTAIAVGRNARTSKPLVQRRTASGWVDQNIVPDNLAFLESVDVASAGPFRAVGTTSRTAHLGTWGMKSAPGGWINDPIPNRNRQINILHDISVRNAGSAWAVGYYETPRFVRRTLTVQLANGQWTIVASPNPNRRHSDLAGVYTVPRSSVVWAVGTKLDRINASHPLVMRFAC